MEDIEGDNSTNIINISRITAAGGQFTGNITPLSGEGIEIFVPTSGVGQYNLMIETLLGYLKI